MKHIDYQQSLYPLQDEILALINGLNLPFYLTGGTALSRYYLNHRYSDDLDLFVNSHADFRALIEEIEAEFKANHVSYAALTRSADFVRLEVIGKDNSPLKLDLVNDLVCHIGGFELSAVLGKVDNVYNILSNKISAIPRLEIKDFADIVFIARKYQFNWETVINEAMQKDTWVNPLDLAKYFIGLDAKMFEQIPWINPINIAKIMQDCEILVAEIVRGSTNSLAKETTAL
ncbi:MAG: nucleotidyl transferase AbiEii/AbiGii toxin family protein [Candidatus Cloacimonetes bacterium]|nr:nucleotidyl transferase AbiEii/AbiGii toxin family protein [Candidatus Cloacimonadota bacterium]MDY0230746.1 nucleotidyl transferase AbiEii/AbiGii toxin family protein [Candidatus Cloacimonadaceae bacterium]